jgi:hypothetical protein
MADGYSHGSLRPVDPDAEAQRLTAERVCHHCGTASSPLMATRDGWQCVHGHDCYRRQDPAAPDINAQRRAAGLTEAPRPAPLTADEILQVLREAVTVVRPGELLIVLVDARDFTPVLLREYNEALDYWVSAHAPGVKILAVIGNGGEVVRQEPEVPLAERVRTLATRDRGRG